jgi:hypothetical protein
MADPDEGGAGDLQQDELEAVVDAVRATVDRDVETLTAIGAFESGSDPYVWVEEPLRLPPGDPREWPISFVRLEDGWYAVDVDMWNDTGRSDLTLQLELRRAHDGTLRTSFEDLHVL